MSIKANLKVEGEKVSLNTEKFTLNRQDFNIVYTNGSPKEKLIEDNLNLSIMLFFTKN